MSDKKSKIAKLLKLKNTLKPEPNEPNEQTSSSPPPRWMEQIAHKTPKSDLNANAAPFILTSNSTLSPYNNPMPTIDINNTENDSQSTNTLNFNNIWDFKSALDESYSALYFDDKFNNPHHNQYPPNIASKHEKIRNFDIAQLTTHDAISFANLKFDQCSLVDLQHRMLQIRDFMMHLLTQKSIQNNNKIIAELGQILDIYQEWIEYKNININMQFPQQINPNIRQLSDINITNSDRELINGMVNEICDEFENDMDLKYIRNNMEMGVYNTFSAVYNDFSEIWMNAKRLEQSVELKLTQIVGVEGVDALKSNKIDNIDVKLKDININIEKELDDPFAVLDDLIDGYKINDFKYDDGDGKREKISIKNDEISNRKKRKKRRRPRKKIDVISGAENINEVFLHEKNLKPDFLQNGELNKNEDEVKYYAKNEYILPEISEQEMVEIAMKNSQKKTKEKYGRDMDKIEVKNNKKKQKFKQNKNKNKHTFYKKKNNNKNEQLNTKKEQKVNKNEEKEKKRMVTPNKNRKKDKNQTKPQIKSKQKVKTAQKSPKLKAKSKQTSNNKSNKTNESKCNDINNIKKENISTTPQPNNDNNNNIIDNEKPTQTKVTYTNKKQQNKNKNKKKHKNKGHHKGKNNKNKGGKKPKEKNKNHPKTTPKPSTNDDMKAKKDLPIDRHQCLSKMGVSQLKNILKPYMQEKKFSTFCEKKEFVSAIIEFESQTTLRRQKWSKFRVKYNIHKDMMSKTHKKYVECHQTAVTQKNCGNEALKNGDYNLAIKHYTESIRFQIDYKAAYTNRSLVYLKQKEYDKCITDCSIIIEMIKMVDEDMLHSNEMFKSYLRRAQAYKHQKKYKLAQFDLDCAMKIKPNDSSVRKLLFDMKVMAKKGILRGKLCNVVSLNDFNSVLNLSVELLQYETSSSSREKNDDGDDDDLFECSECDELLRRLFVFLYKKKKCCQLFVSEHGHILCLKYLQHRFEIGGTKWSSNQGLLGKLYSLLNRCISCINISIESERNNVALLALISSVILFTFKYFECMICELQVTAMRFVSLVVCNDCARDYIVLHCGAEIVFYFSKFQLKTDPLTQDIASIRCLFESLSFLFRSSNFLQLLLAQNGTTGPCFIYVVLLESMYIYVETIKKMDKVQNVSLFKPLQFAISILLDGLAIIFDGGRNNPLLNECEMKLFVHKMTVDFIKNSEMNKKYMILLREYFASTLQEFERCLKKINGKNDINYNEAILYFSQAGKCQNVFTALSYIPCIDLLFKFDVYRELIHLISLCQSMKHRKNSFLYENAQIQSLFSLTRNNILSYFDHISDDDRFDSIFEYFWKYLMHFFVEKYVNIKHINIQQFGHNKSCAIRCVYRWLHRQNKNLCSSGFISENKLLVVIIFKYFVQMMDCLSFNDEQVLANAPLVIRECIKYVAQQQHKCISTISIPDFDLIKLIKFVKKALTPQRIKIVIKLMKTKHAAIQYNAMLLVTQISEYDQELNQICNIYGALKILETYDNARKLKNVEILTEPLHFD